MQRLWARFSGSSTSNSVSDAEDSAIAKEPKQAIRRRAVHGLPEGKITERGTSPCLSQDNSA